MTDTTELDPTRLAPDTLHVMSDQVSDLRKQNQELKIALSCMTASRDRWKAEAKGKITDEWRRRVAAGEEGEVA